MPSLGPFKQFLFNFFIGNSENPPITDEIWWSLDVRYCGAQLYTDFKKIVSLQITVQKLWPMKNFLLSKDYQKYVICGNIQGFHGYFADHQKATLKPTL